MDEIRLGIIGANGRLGKSIAMLALKTPGFSLKRAFTHQSSPLLGSDIGLGIPLSADLLDGAFDLYIDASLPKALPANLQAALASKRPIVVGCTGLGPEERALLEEAARSIPVFYASNFSLGMALLHTLARISARWFDPHARIDLVETHHTKKRDAPGGSALSLAAAIQTSHSLGKAPSIRWVREGDIVGVHELCFANEHEQISLCHTAHGRDAFASGALSAARFLIEQKNGLYGMEDLLGPCAK